MLDDQNEGILYKNNGRACILSNDSFNDFTFEMTLKYDTELANAGSTDNHKEQRMGMHIVFANGKEWYVTVVYQGGSYILQYATLGNSLFANWPTRYRLNVGQIEKLQSADGVTLKVVRQGNIAKVYIDGLQVAQETLDAEYANITAQLGMDAWIANEAPMKVPFSIIGEISK